MNEQQRFKIEIIVFAMVFLLGVWGVLTIASSQSGAADPLFFSSRQTLFLFFSLAAMFVLSKIPYRWIHRFLPQLTVLALMFLLLLAIFGVRINGMKGWYAVGSYQIQPSELTKGIYLLCMVGVMTRFRRPLMQFAAGLSVCLIWVIPILLQPDFGTALVYFVGFLLVYYLNGGKFRYLVLSAAGVLALSGAMLIKYHYALARLAGFFCQNNDPEGASWHLRQFEMAVARGSLWGAKIGKAIWSNAYLPLAYNDSAYASMAETLGLIGVLPLYVFFGMLLYALIELADIKTQKLNFGQLYIASAGVLLVFQFMIHASVNLCLIPTTGLTLPFVSYGGSSLLSSAMMLGIALSLAREKTDDISDCG